MQTAQSVAASPITQSEDDDRPSLAKQTIRMRIFLKATAAKKFQIETVTKAAARAMVDDHIYQEGTVSVRLDGASQPAVGSVV
jgi:type II secretory pathway predicted ATPase ExeA